MSLTFSETFIKIFKITHLIFRNTRNYITLGWYKYSTFYFFNRSRPICSFSRKNAVFVFNVNPSPAFEINMELGFRKKMEKRSSCYKLFVNESIVTIEEYLGNNFHLITFNFDPPPPSFV